MGKEAAFYDQAQDLFVVDGLTLEEIATRLPVSVTSLSKWKQKGDWDGCRREVAVSLAGIKRDRLKLREALLKKALAILQGQVGPQEMYAGGFVERCLGQAEKRGQEKVLEIDRPALFLENLEFMANVLKEADPEGLKILARNFDLIVERFKASHAQAA